MPKCEIFAKEGGFMPDKQSFLDFLKNAPEALASFVKIIQEFYRMQRNSPSIAGGEPGPHEWVAGETHELTTVGITIADLEALEKGYAEAVVKEKFIEFVKGFLIGLTIKGGL